MHCIHLDGFTVSPNLSQDDAVSRMLMESQIKTFKLECNLPDIPAAVIESCM